MHGGLGQRGGVLLVLGTRPEAIKLAPVVAALRRRGAVTVCSTGQHRDLARAALADFDLAADIDLDLMRPRQKPAAFVAAALPRVAAVVARLAPAMVVVQGDTSSALAGALAAAYARLPLGHVEAGLRSYTAEPFPEDLHRRLIAQLATHHFAPTAGAAAALAGEGIAAAAVVVTGNPVIDALHAAAARAACPTRAAAIATGLPPRRPGRHLVLATAHRRENHARMPAIAAAIATLAARGDVDIVVPVHPNPATRTALRHLLGGCDGVALVPPLDYLAFVTLLKQARLVLTDSGGVQEEAPAFGCPVLVLRDSTERPEGIAAGVARLVGTDPATIVTEAARLLDDAAAHGTMATAVLPYGDGHAAERIAALIDRVVAPASARSS